MSDDPANDRDADPDADRDAPIRARLELAADAMVQAPVRWRRVNMLARRKAILSAAATLGLALLAAGLLLFGGSAGRASLHPKEGSPFPLPFVGIEVPDLGGVEIHRAAAKLKALGLKGTQIGSCPRRRVCVVHSTRPSGGRHVFPGAAVELYPLLADHRGHEGGQSTKSPGPTKSGPQTKSTPSKGPTTKGPTKGPKPGNNAVASIAVSLSPRQILADGSSTTTVTARILNAREKLIPNLQPTLRSSDGEEILGSFTESDEAGVYTATLTSSPKAGPVTIGVEAEGRRGEAQLTQVAGAPATISLTLSPERIPADGRSTAILTARVTDANGNPVGAQTVQFAVGEESLPGSEGQPGVYTATLTSSKRAGSVRVVARDGKLTSKVASLQETSTEPEPTEEGEGGGGG